MPGGLNPCPLLSTQAPVGLCLVNCGEFLLSTDPLLQAHSSRGLGAGVREHSFTSFSPELGCCRPWGQRFLTANIGLKTPLYQPTVGRGRGADNELLHDQPQEEGIKDIDH